jgi:hypothetical protein
MDANATLVVSQDRRWFGDPRLGVFGVLVDGRRVGAVPVHDSLRVPVAAGEHAVRINQWRWFRSPAVVLDVQPGTEVALTADIPQALGFVRRFAKFMFSPSSALVLERVDSARTP